MPPALLRLRALRPTHLFVWDSVAPSGVGAGRLANIVMAVFECVAAVVLVIRDINVHGSRARAAFFWHLGFPGPDFLRLVHLVEVFFEKTHVLAVALDCRVGKIANKRHETDNKVDGKVDQHHEQDTIGKTALDLAHAQNQVECKERIGAVTNSRDETNDRGPTEAHSKYAEQGKVEPVGSLASFCEDGGIVLGDVGRNLLLDFLRLAWLPWMWDFLIVRVLGPLLALIARLRHRVEQPYVLRRDVF
jgi:hypothetical protein